jgi:hypothetical protein
LISEEIVNGLRVYYSSCINNYNEFDFRFKASIRSVQEYMSKQDAKRTEYFTVEVDAKVMEREHGCNLTRN